MDWNRFDRTVRMLTTAGTRRGLMSLLAAFPLVGGLAALTGVGASAASRSVRASNKHHHKHKKHKHRKHCTPQPVAQVCAGQCGVVTNNCGQPVQCGIPLGEPCTPTTPETPNACCSGQCGCAGTECTCRNADCNMFACGVTADCCQGTCAAGISQCTT
jgi:hypothetical protein